MVTSKALPTDSTKRRRISRWAAVNAWKLAGSTALVASVGTFIAVSLSIFLRPTRSYFFPLLSDVDKYQPEASILRLAFVISTALLIATTTASVLHCQSLRLFTRERTSHQSSDFEDILGLENDLLEITPNPTTKKRLYRLHLTQTQLYIIIALFVTLFFSFIHYSGFLQFLVEVLHRRVVIRLGISIVIMTWITAMCFLTWYFLKLQNIPDRNVNEYSIQNFSDDSQGEGYSSDETEGNTNNFRLTDHVKSWMAWLVVLIRPICLTGQVVCVIKIFGLWLALDTFSISNIRLVKIALLAALAFAEYTAAFFFAFFMTILAVDMRSKAMTNDALV